MSSSPPVNMPKAPYVGLRPYAEKESAIFAGRREQTDNLCHQLAKSRFLAILGESGVGKSSLLRAGLVPLLKEGYEVNGRSNWQTCIFTPGDKPLERFTRALLKTVGDAPEGLSQKNAAAHLRSHRMQAILEWTENIFSNGTANLLIVLDQFEDLFRIADNLEGEDAANLVSILTALVDQSVYPIYVVFGIRTDYLPYCRRFNGLLERIDNNSVHVLPLTRSQVREVLKEPLRQYGTELTPRLMGWILNDFEENQTPLPILQHAMCRLWHHWKRFIKDPVIDNMQYEAIQKLDRAIAFHAEYAMIGMNKEDRWLVQRLFQCLVESDSENRKYARKIRLSRIEAIIGESRDNIWALVHKFREKGRLMIRVLGVSPGKDAPGGNPILELAYESMIPRWPKLQEWADQEGERAEIYKELAHDARNHRDGKAALWTGDQLTRGLRWLREEPPNQAWADLYDPDFQLAVDFLKKSENERKKNNRPVKQRPVPNMEEMAAPVVGSSRPGLHKEKIKPGGFRPKPPPEEPEVNGLSKSASEASDEADHLDFSLPSDDEPLPSLEQIGDETAGTLPPIPLSIKKNKPIVESRPSKEPEDSPKQREKTGASPKKKPRPHLHTRRPKPGGRATWGMPPGSPGRKPGGIIRENWVKPPGAEPVNPIEDAPVRIKQKRAVNPLMVIMTLAIFVLGWFAIRFWHASEEERKAKEALHRQTQNDLARSSWYQAMDARRENQRLKSLQLLSQAGFQSVPPSGIARSSMINIQQEIEPVLLIAALEHNGSVKGVVPRNDGESLLTFSDDGTLRLWHGGTGELLATMEHGEPVEGAVFNKDQSLVLSWAKDGSARIWRTEDGTPASPPMYHNDRILGAVFNEDESLVLSYSDDGTAQVWNAADATPAGPPLKHEQAVEGAMFSEDQTMVLTFSRDGSARLWNAADSQPIGRAMDHDGPIINARFNKDQSRILTCSQDGTARLWSTAGRPATAPMRHGPGLRGAVYNNDQDLIATYGADGLARLWKTNGKSQANPINHGAPITGLVFCSDDQRVLTFGENGYLKLWLNDGRSTGSFMKHKDRVTGVLVSRDQNQILSWSEDGTARLWNMNGSSAINPLIHGDVVLGASFDPEERLILTYSHDGFARLWDRSSGQPVGTPMFHGAPLVGAQFSGNRIFTYGEDGSARVWHIMKETGQVLTLQHDQWVRGATFSKNGDMVLSYSKDKTARLWRTSDGELMQTILHSGPVSGAVFNKREDKMLTFSEDGTAMIWATKSGSPQGTAMKHKGPVLHASFSKDESMVLTWSEDHTARIWNTISGAPKTPPLAHDGPILGACFNKDESLVLTYSEDATARLWRSDNKPTLQEPFRHDGPLRGAIFSPDQIRILTFGDDGAARLWRIRDGESGPVMRHDGAIRGAIYTKEGKHILTYSDDGSARLWNSADGSPAAQPMRHGGPVRGAVFDKEEKHILTFSEDGSARIWNAENGQAIGKPMFHEGWVLGARFIQDDALIVTHSMDGSARLWFARDGEPASEPLSHELPILDVALNGDESLLLTYSLDGAAGLWHVIDGSPVASPFRHKGAVTHGAFSPDGSRLLTTGADGLIFIRNLAVDQGFPKEHLPLFVEVLTGTTMNHLGNIIALSPDEWAKKKEAYLPIANQLFEKGGADQGFFPLQKNYWE